jgi:hypothetical protein
MLAPAIAGAFFVSIATAAMRWFDIDGPPMLARGKSGCRPLATKIGRTQAAVDALRTRAGQAIRSASARAGQVESIGSFSDIAAHDALASGLGISIAPHLRPGFEWYLCRGAFFHNDAHYSDVLFGIWYVDGPPMDIVFPRAQLRLPTAPGDIIVFDPFEIHGVLYPGEQVWEAERYADCAYSTFAGFEISLDPAVQSVVGMQSSGDARVLSSATRISAATGAIS